LSGIVRTAACLLVLIATTAFAGDFVDHPHHLRARRRRRAPRLGADHAQLAERGPSAPAQNTQFYDNFNTRFTGFETLTNAVLYKKSPSFFEHFDAEAALGSTCSSCRTAPWRWPTTAPTCGSTGGPAGWGVNENISFTGFPVVGRPLSARLRLPDQLGGSSAFTTRAAADGVPGAKLLIQRDRWYAFIA